jgi:hypothetical protein
LCFELKHHGFREHLQAGRNGWLKIKNKAYSRPKGGMNDSQNGNSSSLKHSGSVITAPSRTSPWLASGWGCREIHTPKEILEARAITVRAEAEPTVRAHGAGISFVVRGSGQRAVRTLGLNVKKQSMG